jgi:hypothetical protein
MDPTFLACALIASAGCPKEIGAAHERIELDLSEDQTLNDAN